MKHAWAMSFLGPFFFPTLQLGQFIPGPFVPEAGGSSGMHLQTFSSATNP